MKAKSNELTVDSMAQRYSLGHKALSVALSVVLMGFGWPAVSPSQVYAGDGAAADDAAAQVEGASSGAATSSADKAADTAASSAASAESSAAPAASEQPTSTASQQQAAPSASESAQPAATQEVESAKQDAETADVELVLGNASITYMNQVVSAPAKKVTVPVKDDFKFTVSPDNGYNLTKAVLKVSGKENPISPDDQGVYTVSATDVAAGATVTLETEAVSSESGKNAAAVSIEDDATEKTQASVSGAGAISGPTSVAQGDEVTLADSTKKPDNTDFEKWIYVGETATYQGTSGNEWSNYSSWWYPGKDEGFISFEKDGDSVTVTGQAKGDVVLMHGYWNSSWQWITEKFTIHVLPKAPITSLEITDSDTTVEQFKSITLKTNADTDVTWTSSDPSVATIDAAGKVVGVKPGKVTIVATTVTAEGKVLTATHEVAVTESTAQQINAKLFFLKSPTNNPDSNSAGDWFPTGGQSNLGVKVNVEGAAFSGQNTWDNVANRVVKWPDGSAGSSWTLPQGNSYWDKVFDSYKSEIEDKLHVSISKDDVEAIVLHPYKISNNSGIYHLDCKVEIKVKQVVTATFWLQSAGATGFDKQYSVSTLEVKDGAAQVVAPAAPEAEKTVNGVTYKFMGWYSDKDCTQPVTFPVTTAENVFYYGKYVPCDQSIQVNYYLDNTNTPVAPSQTLTGYMKGQKVTQTPIDIPGYTPVSTDAKSGVVGTDSSINFYYRANPVDYSVEYYWTGSDEPLSPSEKHSGHVVGDQVTGLEPKAIAGYTPVSDNVKDLKLGADESKNVVKFYYRQNVSLTANSDDNKTYNGSEQSVEGYTTNLPEGASTSFDGVTLEGGKGTNAGDYPYTFANGTIGKVSSDNNYVVTQTTPGNLHIGPVTDEVTITISGHNGGEKYSGEEQSVSGYDVSGLPAGVGEGDISFTGKAEAKGTDAGEYKMGLAETQFSLKGDAAKNYVNVKFRVGRDGVLTIGKRTVILTSEDGDKNYDGKTLQRRTNIGERVSGDGFAGKDGVLAKDKLTWYDENNILPGTYENKFEPAYTSSTNLNNYDVQLVFGKLVVNARADNKKYEVTVKGASGTSVYNGQPHSATGLETTSYTNKEGVRFSIRAKTSGAESKVDAGTYENKVSDVVVTDPHGNDVTDQFKITTEDGKLTIDKRAVTITAGSAEKEYDGSALTADQADPKFTTKGFVDGQGISNVTVEGSQTQCGTSASTIKDNSWKFQTGTNGDNYSVTVKPGTLTVKHRSDDKKYAITLTGKSDDGATYDGKEHTVSGVEQDRWTFDGVEYTVSNYRANASGTDAGTYSNIVTSGERGYKVTDPNGNDVTEEFSISVAPGTLTISPAEVTVTAGSATRTYNGSALTAAEAEREFMADGFVGDDGIASARVDGSITNVGETDSNVVQDSVVLKDGTKASNYNITYKPGKLEVTPNTDEVVVTIAEKSDAKEYNGSEQSIEGYSFANISNSNYAATAVKFVGSPDDKVAKGTDAGTYEMNLKPEDFKNGSANFANVKFEIVDGSLVIAKRAVTLTSDTPAEKTYDGNPLEDHNVSVTSGSLATGDKLVVDVTGSQTDAGSSANAFTYELVDAAGNGLAKDAEGAYRNYNVTKVEGVLKVNPVSDEVVVTITGDHAEGTYNGKPLTATGYTFASSNALYTSAKVAFSGENSVSRTDAGTTVMDLQGKFANADAVNFPNVRFNITNGSVAISKAKVTLRSADLTKEYDGTALTNKNGGEGQTPLAEESGWVEGEGAAYVFTGSQTLVGGSPNAFNYTLNGNTKEGNYDIGVIPGQLTVTNRQAQYQVTVEANSSTGNRYDGVEHAATGLKTSEFTVDGQKYTVEGLNTSDPRAVNAGEYANTISGTPVVKDANGNDVSSQFAVTLVPGKLEIAKRSVTLTSASDSRVYNGEALTNDGVTVGGDGFVAGEGAVYNVTGTITDAGKVANSFTYERNSNTNFDNYTITKEEGTLEVTPVADKVTVTITGNSATLPYSGSEQSVAGYDFKASNPLYKEGDLAFSGTAVAKGTNAGTYNMNLASGLFSNISGNFTNVEFVVVDGSLEITGGDLDAGKVVWDVHDVQKVYDGTPLSAYVAKATDKFGNALKVEYSTDGEQWTDDPSSITLTHFGYQEVKLRATGANYAAGQYAENKDGEWVAITSRPVKLTSKGDNKKYDGKPLTNDTVTVETKGEGTGFIDGEGVTINVTGSQTDAGESDNTFDYTFNEGTNANDYWVTTEYGKLVVTASDSEVVATIAGHNKTVEYNGSEQSVEGYDFVEEASNPLYKEGDFTFSGEAIAKGTNVGTYNMNLASEQFINKSDNFSKVVFAVTDGTLTITPKSIVPDPENPKNTMSVDSPADVVYNGQDQTWTPVVKDGERTLEPGKDYTVEYSTADHTNVTGKITVTITGIGNYSGKVERTYQITKRTVGLKSEGGSKPYDGTALTKPEVSGWQQQGDTGFVTGEVSNVRATGSVTTVAQGGVTNSIAYDTNAGFNESNYTISKDEGKLSITALAAEDGIAITPNNATYIYDASSHEAGAAAASASVAGTDVNLEYRVNASADTEWRSNASAITAINAGALTVEVRASAANYSGYKYAEQTLTIQKRDVELTSASASKVYDGAPLAKDWVDMGPNRPDTGFIWTDLSGDGQVHATGSQTEVGSSENVISYQLKPGAENNYNIIGEHVGTLTVTAQSITPDPQNPDSYKGVAIDEPNDHVYDGTEHKWAPEVTDKDGNKLVEGSDYTVTYDTDDFVNVKVVNVTIAGKGSYTGTCVKAYEITKAPLIVNAESASKVYDGEALTAGATIEGLVGGETAAAQAHGSQTEVGSSANTVSDITLDDITWDTAKKGNYYIAAQNDGTLTVTPKGIAQMTVSSLPDVIYNGESQQQKPVVKDGEKALTEGVDYELTYSENTTDAGTVTVTVTGKGNYAGSVDVEYLITPAPLAVATPSASGVYNGKPLTAAGSVSGFVNGESAPFETTGSQTEVGTSDNTYAIDWAAAGATAKQANYTVSESIGKLTVTEFADQVVVTTTGGAFTYDGTAHGATVTVGALPEGYTLEAAASSATATNVSDGEVAATADVLVIKNAQGEDVTSKLNVKFVDGAIKVEPAKLTVTTPSASKPYDGNALTAEGKASGFVNGEAATLKTTGGQTTVGTSENGYELVWDDNAKAENYTVEENLGTLEVTKSMAGIVVIPQGGTKVYDGTALESAGVNVIGVPAGFALSAKTKGSTTDAGYVTAEVDSYIITNAAGQDVTDQFGNVATGKASLVVTKRPVTLVSGDASKVYDGTALTEHKVSVEDGSLASGEEFGYDFFGFQTSVGSSKNTFAAKPGNGSTKVENYDITYRYGTLTVSAQSINPDDPIPGAYAGVKVNAPSDAVYDAREHKWIPVVTGKDGNALVEGRDYTVTYSTDDFTNVTGAIKVTITGIGDYTGSVTREYQIAPAFVKLASNTREFLYNGAYQSDDAVTVQGAEALFRSQVDDLQAVGKVMTVAEGKVPNTIAYTWKDGFKVSNFAIEKNEGELSVVVKDIVSSADMTVSSPSDLVYDGREHKWAPEVKDGEKLLTEGVDYTVSYSADDFTNVTGVITVTVTGQGNYAGSVERAYRITPAPLTVATPSASGVYNGNALTAAGSVSGFVSGESAPFETTGSQTEVGTSDNTYAIDWAAAGATAKQANYTVSESIGKLTVTEFAGRVVATPGSYSGVYDGQAHGVDVTVSGLPEGYSVKAAHSNATATDATDEAGVTASVDELVIVNAQGEDVTDKLDIERQAGAIKIAPAEYHVVTEGAFKVYDGTALTAPGKIVGLVNGEEASLSVTGSQTDAGSIANAYAIAFDKSAKEGNYIHGADVIGTLEVAAAKAEGKIALSGSSASKVYDGKPLAAQVASATVPTQDPVTIEYSLDGESWTTDPGSLTATDVADSATVQLRASSLGNYEGYVYGSQQLSVTKRAVNLKSDSASKVFDGTALTRPEVVGWKQLGDEGFVDGQVSAVRATGSATHVSDGKVANTIVYTESEGFNADNYAISKDEGVLSVTAKQIAAADMTVRAPADVVYSGKAQQQKPVVKDGDKVLVEGVDYELTYSGNATDAGTVTVTVTGKGDYAGSVDVAYQIAPAPLTVTTESANKVYDGKPLTADGKVDGLVNGETVAFKVVGSQTKVGESDNAYKIEWSGTAKRANYRLEAETIGKLTVTESADEVVVTTTGGTFTYDGASHGATVKVANLPEGYSLETAESAASAKDVSDGEVAATADVLVIKNAEGEDVTSKLNIKFVDDTIKVEPAKLTVTTPSVTRVFDGDALTAEGRVSGFVSGETATFKTTGSQTEVGSSVNGYELVWDGSAKAANYTVVENLGTLTVSAQSIDPDDAGAFGGVTVGYLADTVYNGADQRFEPEVVDKGGKALVKGRDYELSFSGDVKNVGEVTVIVIGKGNFAGSVERTYHITPAPLAVTTGSDSKIYDGSELTNSELSIEGLQGEDRVTAATTGSQTEVGSSENTYRITWGDVDAANYVIDEHLGTLTVTPAPVPPTPNPDDGTTPTPEPTPSPTPGDGSTPGTTPDGTTPGSTPNPGNGSTPASASTPAPAAAGPLDALADVLEGAYESVTGGPEADNPVEEERIYDAENPLGRESVEDRCWVHWYMIVGMVLTAVYGLAAALRRKNHERKLRNDMNDVLGDGDGKDPSGSPAAKPAGMEA
ncbi:Ig-like domain-containing protein [uncultured Senegalimassilia sp.]|uniref:Ig-like domain-containing protein n=1 Tax=uncultured Senegalimassilia sp. TaxID=1714350 RepID=UPI0027DC5FB1|nr:Ig-like domain-containing protein [uncultured Senegalimassilia sp.]